MQTAESFERARLSRDHRFDGRFYVAVLTTGIYCRPICPANPPKRENIRFYPTAPAAAEAGFRPCLRCRPECAPGSPAWTGTSTTVRRGLKLIASGALDQGNVETLADRLGVTSRHLRRLFNKHIGASPLSVAHTQRLHFAKRLIDETQLPLSSIADAAGYGSVRRFNDAFRKTYGRPPRELRKINDDNQATERRPTLTVRLPYREPFDWQSMLQFLSARITAGVERIDGDSYARTLRIGDDHAVLDVRPDKRSGYLSMTMHGIPTTAIFDVVQRARDAFDLDAPVDDIAAVLGKDALLKSAIRRFPGLRVPGAWDGFELTIRAILGQQISVKAATTLSGRIAERYGDAVEHDVAADMGLRYVFPRPERLARARYNNIGLVSSRAQTLRSVSSEVARGLLNFDAGDDPDEFCNAFKSIKGIGDWTAQYVAMRALKSPDAFPTADLGLLKAVGDGRPASPKELAERAERWRPWRAYAALLLWSRLGDSGG